MKRGVVAKTKNKGRKSKDLRPLRVVGATRVELATPTVSRCGRKKLPLPRPSRKPAKSREIGALFSANWLADAHSESVPNTTESATKRHPDCGKLR